MILPETLRKITEQNRNATFPAPHDDLKTALDGFKTPNLDAGIDTQIAARIKQYKEQDISSPTEISHEDIIRDIDFLFDMLRYGYGAYQFYGGDDTFLPLKGSMLEQLKNTDNPLAIDAYTELLVASLRSIVVDIHFSLGDCRIGAYSQLWMNDEHIIRKDGADYIVEIDGAAHRVLDGEILPTLTCDGELVWAFGYVRYGLKQGAERLEQNVTIKLQSVESGEMRNISVVMQPATDTDVSRDSIFAICEQSGIKILENRRLWERDNESDLDEFPSTGRTLRDEPILILDLRGNGGGNDGLASDWIEQYTGQAPNYGMMFRQVRLNSLTVNELNQGIESASPPSWQVGDYGNEHRFIPNKNLLIVLMDNRIGSAGDTFVGYLRQLENVLFVGANTMGVLTTGNVGSAVLPYSRLKVNFGVSLNVRTDLSQFEGIGFVPDLWVAPNDALERTLKFIERQKEIQ